MLYYGYLLYSEGVSIFGGNSALDSDGGLTDHLQRNLHLIILSVICVLTVCSTLILLRSWHPIVRFDSEVISVTVDPERITVDGVYRLYNPLPFPMPQRFFYPTPVGGGLEPADELLIKRLPVRSEDLGNILEPQVLGNRKYYLVHVPGRTTLEVRVYYSQRHNGNSGRYILTTTSGWGRPLQQANFELTLKSLDLGYSNYELTANRSGTWFFKRTDFMPEEDWVFTFRKWGGVS